MGRNSRTCTKYHTTWHQEAVHQADRKPKLSHMCTERIESISRQAGGLLGCQRGCGQGWAAAGGLVAGR
eukprot:1152171-Pelagomonas_calceolata.AAC.9